MPVISGMFQSEMMAQGGQHEDDHGRDCIHHHGDCPDRHPAAKLSAEDRAARRRFAPGRCERPGQRRVVFRAIARAWDWRRRLEAGEVSTLQDLADAENVTLQFVSRFIRLAYLSPMVVERIVSEGEGIAVSLDRLAVAALELWARQPAKIFNGPNCPRSQSMPGE